MISEGLKSNTTLTSLNLRCNRKKQIKDIKKTMKGRQ